MKYRVTCLTPTLVGDGQKLSPIDYMVWRIMSTCWTSGASSSCWQRVRAWTDIWRS